MCSHVPVHGALVDSVLAAGNLVGAALSAADSNRYVAEMVTAAELTGVPRHLVPSNVPELDLYIASVRPTLRCTPAAAESMVYLLDPPGMDVDTVQQQALRDFTRAMTAFFDPGNPAGRPSWRKAGRDEGFRITGQRGRQWDVRRVSRHVGQVWVPKAGWVRFRWSRAVPPGAKSYRVTRDRAGRWHIAFAVIPAPVPAPGNGQVVGIDRGDGVMMKIRQMASYVHRRDTALPRPGRAGAEAAAAAAAPAGPRPAGIEPPRPGQARDREAAGPGE